MGVGATTTRDPFDVLGVEHGVHWRAVLAAYRRHAQIHHPDRYASSRPDVRDEANRLMAEVNAAFDALAAHRRGRVRRIVDWNRGGLDSPYATLGLDDNASWDEVVRAAECRAEIYDPSRYAGGSLDVRAEATRLHARVQLAYELLRAHHHEGAPVTRLHAARNDYVRPPRAKPHAEPRAEPHVEWATTKTASKLASFGQVRVAKPRDEACTDAAIALVLMGRLITYDAKQGLVTGTLPWGTVRASAVVRAEVDDDGATLLTLTIDSLPRRSGFGSIGVYTSLSQRFTTSVKRLGDPRCARERLALSEKLGLAQGRFAPDRYRRRTTASWAAACVTVPLGVAGLFALDPEVSATILSLGGLIALSVAAVKRLDITGSSPRWARSRT